MDDNQIVDLFWQRSEEAISMTSIKYGKYCYFVANNILHSEQDSMECVNDTYMRAWNAIPPQRPAMLKSFLGKITRNLSLNRYESMKAQKRGAGQIPLVLDELASCIPSENNTENIFDENELVRVLNSFLSTLSPLNRKIFMRRYWYFSSIRDIAKDNNMSVSNVKTTLFRTRNKLKDALEKEGVVL